MSYFEIENILQKAMTEYFRGNKEKAKVLADKAAEELCQAFQEEKPDDVCFGHPAEADIIRLATRYMTLSNAPKKKASVRSVVDAVSRIETGTSLLGMDIDEEGPVRDAYEKVQQIPESERVIALGNVLRKAKRYLAENAPRESFVDVLSRVNYPGLKAWA